MDNKHLNQILGVIVALILLLSVGFQCFNLSSGNGMMPEELLASTENGQVIAKSDTQEVEDTSTSVTVQESKSNTGDNDPEAYYNLNTVTYEELLTIEGIGPAKADAILTMRDTLGGFANLEQLMDVDGIGEKTFETIAPHFYL